ncbi:MAG: hypothetical protein Q8O25_02315 [Sulfurisoma sp.]|nr:hypothetical protein [Sulfurisoma sp.]
MAAASLAYTTVIFSSLFGLWPWGESLPWPTWLGIALIVAGGVAATRVSRVAPAGTD